jgi:transposase-like protein
MTHSCPNCGGASGPERQATFHADDVVRVVFVCHECPTQFTVEYGDPEVVSTVDMSEHVEQ